MPSWEGEYKNVPRRKPTGVSKNLRHNGGVPTYRDEAIVLRTHKLGEADRIITLLTRNNGKVRAVAKGVRRTSSRFGARLEPFSYVQVQLYQGRNLDTVTQVVTKDAFGGKIVTDYPLFTAGQVMLEAADKLVTVDREPATGQFLLLVGAVRALVEGTWDGPRPGSMILDSYLLRSLAISGYAVSLKQCAGCSKPGLHSWFSASAGGVVCEQCRQISATKVSHLDIAYLIALTSGDWPSTRTVSASCQMKGSELVEKFFSWHIDHTVKSLNMVDRQFGIEDIEF